MKHTKRLRVGHMGTLHDHSSGKLECVLKFPELFEVVGVAEDDPKRRAQLRQLPPYRDLPILTKQQLLDAGCDCMLIEGFEYDLPCDAMLCIQNGIPVHIDKPGGRDLAMFTSMLAEAKKRQLPVQMAYMYRYNPAVADCLSKVRAGRLGEIYSVSAIMNTGHDAQKRRWLQQFEGGIMFFLGCHMVDLIYQLQGYPDAVTPFLRSSGFDGVTAADQATAIFTYRNGLSIAQANACEVNGFGRRQLVVCGSEGTYEIHPLERPIRAAYTHASFAETFYDRHQELSFRTVPPEERYDAMILDFAAMVRGEKENPFSYETELHVQQLVLAACGCSAAVPEKNL